MLQTCLRRSADKQQVCSSHRAVWEKVLCTRYTLIVLCSPPRSSQHPSGPPFFSVEPRWITPPLPICNDVLIIEPAHPPFLPLLPFAARIFARYRRANVSTGCRTIGKSSPIISSLFSLPHRVSRNCDWMFPSLAVNRRLYQHPWKFLVYTTRLILVCYSAKYLGTFARESTRFLYLPMLRIHLV